MSLAAVPLVEAAAVPSASESLPDDVAVDASDAAPPAWISETKDSRSLTRFEARSVPPVVDPVPAVLLAACVVVDADVASVEPALDDPLCNSAIKD